METSNFGSTASPAQTLPTESTSNVSVKTPEGQDGTAAKEAADLPEWKKMKHKLTVDGSEMELDYDDLVKRASKVSAADKRFQEASQLRQTVENFASELESNPTSALKKLGADKYFKENKGAVLELLGHDTFRELAESVLWEQMQYEKLTPEQKRLLELEEKNKRYEETEKQQKERLKAEQFDTQVKQYEENFSRLIDDTLAKANLPKTPYNVRRVATQLEKSITNQEDANPEMFATSLKGEVSEEFSILARSLPASELCAMLGDEVVKKVREHELSKLKSPTGKAMSFGATPQNSGVPKLKDKMPTKDFFAEMRRRNGKA